MSTSTVTPEFTSLREKIAWEKEQRLARYAHFEAAFDAAATAARDAGDAVTPAPSIVGTAIGLSDEIDPTKPVYRDTAGICGFAWVDVRPATSSFARWLAKTGRGSKAYGGGMRIRIPWHGQSYERKIASAQVLAGELNRLLPEAEFGPLLIAAGGRLD